MPYFHTAFESGDNILKLLEGEARLWEYLRRRVKLKRLCSDSSSIKHTWSCGTLFKMSFPGSEQAVIDSEQMKIN